VNLVYSMMPVVKSSPFYIKWRQVKTEYGAGNKLERERIREAD
jgi:hypothetical protein